MKRLTSSVYSFEKIINEGKLYVDKTEYIWNLIQDDGSYFLARPRRFGKSLTVSTLEAVFQGRKDLFKGLAIYDKPYDWKKYPVIHLDLSKGDYSSLKQTSSALSNMVARCAQAHGIKLKRDVPNEMFQDLIIRLSKKGQVVILVDEYDKPILETLGEPYAKDVLKLLKAFYSVIKSYDANERFVFITGVSKFSHVSLFSGMNNPSDLSMRSEYATMFGYTQTEFEDNFAEYIDAATEKLGIPREEFLQKMKYWYDGYRFEAEADTVYNPVSVAKFFEPAKPSFSNYWFATGTPSFLLTYCRDNSFDFAEALSGEIPELSLDAYDIDTIAPLALFIQTGYLTIKDAIVRDDQTYYHLKFPNFEVKWAFEVHLLNTYTDYSAPHLTKIYNSLRQELKAVNVDKFMKSLNSFYAALPYKIQSRQENYYQTIFFMLFYFLDFDVDVETMTNQGRIDAVITLGKWVFLFEFKVDQKAKVALAQIRRRKYFQKYLLKDKRIMVIGASFNSKTRELSDWEFEEAKQ